MTKEGGTY